MEGCAHTASENAQTEKNINSGDLKDFNAKYMNSTVNKAAMV